MQEQEVFMGDEPTRRERLLVERTQCRGHDLPDTQRAEVVDEFGHVVRAWRRAVHGHHLGGSAIATPWTEADNGASPGCEPLDTGDTGETGDPGIGRHVMQSTEWLGDATRR